LTDLVVQFLRCGFAQQIITLCDHAFFLGDGRQQQGSHINSPTLHQPSEPDRFPSSKGAASQLAREHRYG